MYVSAAYSSVVLVVLLCMVVCMVVRLILFCAHCLHRTRKKKQRKKESERDRRGLSKFGRFCVGCLRHHKMLLLLLSFVQLTFHFKQAQTAQASKQKKWIVVAAGALIIPSQATTSPALATEDTVEEQQEIET